MHLLEISYVGKKPEEINPKDSLLESSEKMTFSKKEFCIIHLSSLNFWFFKIHRPISTNAKQKVESCMNFPKPSVWTGERLNMVAPLWGKSSRIGAGTSQQVCHYTWTRQPQACGEHAWFSLAGQSTCWGVRIILGWRQEKLADKGLKVESRLTGSAYCSGTWNLLLYLRFSFT